MKNVVQINAASHDTEHASRGRLEKVPRTPTHFRQFRLSQVDAEALAATLRRRIEGEVRFDRGSRGLYATDGSNYRQVPIGVVIPRHAGDVLETLAACREFGAPVLSRGGGTSLAGQCCNVAVVMDFSKYMHQVLEIDPERKLARVEPGCVLDDLRKKANRHNLTFAPDPATHDHCTLGGMIGNNSCGVHSVMAGKTAENTHALDIVLYDGTRMTVGKTSDDRLQQIIREGGRRGEIYQKLVALRDRYAELIRTKYPKIPRRVSGYNLDELLPENGFHVARALVGTEATCMTVLEATVELVYWPPYRTLVVLGFDDVYKAGDHVPAVLEYGPQGLEGIDDKLIGYMKKKHLHEGDLSYLPEGKGFLLVEFGADTQAEADEKAAKCAAGMKKYLTSSKVYDDKEEEKKVWEIRESGLGATANVPGEPLTWEGWEDSAVPPQKVGHYLRDLRKLLEKHGYGCALYGHFGQGCIHTRIDFDLQTHDGIANYRSFISEAADLVVSYGGSLSGEHGDGQSRAEFLPKMFGPELVDAFREFKSIWDPAWKMNPGKVVDPYRVDENLRLGADYNPPNPRTNFTTFDGDGPDFAKAALRCVGVGKCRREEPSGGVMCPSYMVTREEKHSTRGRARMLFEMLQGDPVESGWRDPYVKEALDLCLSCKGCKSDCPVNVDMATYKAEFLSHYWENRIRPPQAYSMGLIYWWARAASMAPGLVNLVTHTPGLDRVVKAIGGIAPERRMPTFAGETFRAWFARHKPRNPAGKRVLLWADTFNNHFHPQTAKAAVEVLEDAGFRVVVPKQNLCCGRPLYDYGFLDTARGMLEEILGALKPEIEAGTPVVGLEPSCMSVLKDEMKNMLPFNQDAHRLREKTFVLSEFLEKEAPHYEPPKLRRKAVVQGHCHHHAVFNKLKQEQEVMKKMELDFELLDSGCCGMAGSFGFEADKYEVSKKIAEAGLLPAIRKASKDTLIIADGFSCREQIEDLTDRRGLHLAEIIQIAKREGPGGPAGDYPERRYLPPDAPMADLRTLALVGAGALAAGALLWMVMRRD